MKQNTEQLKKIEEIKALIKTFVLNEKGIRYTAEKDSKYLDKRIENYVEMLSPHITKTTPSHDEIKREAYKEGIWHAVYNYVEKAWEDGYLNGLNGMDLINMRRDFIAKVEKDTEARLTQSKEGGE